MVASGGLALLGESRLYGGAIGFRLLPKVYVQIGFGTGSGETRNENGIPIDLDFQAYGVSGLYQITDLFVIGGGFGLLSMEASIGSRWSDDLSVPFVTVLGGVKVGPLLLTGGVALPLGD